MRISDWSSDVCSSDLWPANLQTLTRGAPGCIPGFLRSSRVSMHQASTGEPRMLKEVGGVTVQARHRATCHCGAVELELDLPDGIVDPRRCDCSICRRKGAVVASVPLAGLRIVRGSEHLRLYEFNPNTAKHYFRGTCGIYKIGRAHV